MTAFSFYYRRNPSTSIENTRFVRFARFVCSSIAQLLSTTIDETQICDNIGGVNDVIVFITPFLFFFLSSNIKHHKHFIALFSARALLNNYGSRRRSIRQLARRFFFKRAEAREEFKSTQSLYDNSFFTTSNNIYQDDSLNVIFFIQQRNR